MPLQIALPIALRLGAAAVFIVAVIVAGTLNRPFILVPLIAAAATLTQFAANRVAPGPIAQIGAALNSGASQQPSLKRLWVSFLLGTAGYSVLFILTVFLSALFQETELARALNWTDFWLLAIPSGAALILSLINARASAAQVAGMMSGLNTAFGEQNPESDTDAFTVEGELIDPDDHAS